MKTRYFAKTFSLKFLPSSTVITFIKKSCSSAFSTSNGYDMAKNQDRDLELVLKCYYESGV